MSNYNFN